MPDRKIGLNLETGEIDYEFYRQIMDKFANIDAPQEEMDYIYSILEIRSFKKGSHLLTQGARCQELYFIIKGGARFYYLNNTGDEVTYNFIFENNFVVPFNSLFTGAISQENIVALEDTIVFVLPYEELEKLLARHPVWVLLLNKLLTKHFIRVSEKEKMLLLEDFNSRYSKLMETRPYLFQRVDQQHIASYLGMTPETLSRIKKRMYSLQKNTTPKNENSSLPNPD